jgi:hypothetical protein
MAITNDNVVSLDEFLSGDEPDYTTEPAAPVDMDQAERWLRHYRRLQTEADRALEVANAERARIDLWLSVELDRIGRQQAWFEQGLTQMHAAVLRVTPKAKTLRLPSGTLKARAQQPEWSIDDEPAFLTWAREHRPELVNQPVPPPAKPAKADAKKVLELTEPKARAGERVAVRDPQSGEVVPGVTVLIRGEAFSIDLADIEEGDDDGR